MGFSNSYYIHYRDFWLMETYLVNTHTHVDRIAIFLVLIQRRILLDKKIEGYLR